MREGERGERRGTRQPSGAIQALHGDEFGAIRSIQKEPKARTSGKGREDELGAIRTNQKAPEASEAPTCGEGRQDEFGACGGRRERGGGDEQVEHLRVSRQRRGAHDLLAELGKLVRAERALAHLRTHVFRTALRELAEEGTGSVRTAPAAASRRMEAIGRHRKPSEAIGSHRLTVGCSIAPKGWGSSQMAQYALSERSRSRTYESVAVAGRACACAACCEVARES